MVLQKTAFKLGLYRFHLQSVGNFSSFMYCVLLVANLLAFQCESDIEGGLGGALSDRY